MAAESRRVKDTSDIALRDVAAADMAAICEIYAHHVIHGLASWEEIPPDLSEMTRRKDAIVADGFPYRIAVRGETVLGYAYVGKYRPRPAYRNTVENSLYVAEAARGLGIGTLLLNDLIEICTAQGFCRMVGIVGDSANAASIGLHEKAGFEMVGVIPACGYKAGQWLDQVLLHRTLGAGDTQPPEK